jgi:hypothetical protein
VRVKRPYRSDGTYHSQTQPTAHDIMSLLLPSSWNQPILVAASGVAAAALLPVLERRGQLPLSSLQLLQVAAYAVNVWATAQPGRLDGQMAVQMAAAPPQQQQEDASRSKKNQGGKKTDDDTNKKEKKTSADIIDPAVAAISTGRHGRTLLIPKGWAFIIWAPIFMGELLHVATSCLLTSSSAAAGTIRLLQRTAPGFVIAQLFQSLWAASFRPKYKGLSSFISFAMLSGIAISLNGPHAAIAASAAHAHDNNNVFLNLQTYLLHGLPITLHFGWTTAASLVNLNGCYAMMADSSDKWLTAVGHASVVVATALGVAVTLSRQAPVYGGVICWALLACADGMADRLKSSSVPVVQQQGGGQSSSTTAVAPARVQQWLCWVGAGIVAAASIVATAARWSLIIAPGGK